MLEMPERWDTCQGELLSGSGTSPGERSVLHSTQLRRVELCRALTSDMEMQSLELAQRVLSLALVQGFLPVLPFFPFRMLMYVVCHCLLNICDLLFYFDFIGDYI